MPPTHTLCPDPSVNVSSTYKAYSYFSYFHQLHYYYYYSCLKHNPLSPELIYALLSFLAFTLLPLQSTINMVARGGLVKNINHMLFLCSKLSNDFPSKNKSPWNRLQDPALHLTYCSGLFTIPSVWNAYIQGASWFFLLLPLIFTLSYSSEHPTLNCNLFLLN